MTSRRINQARLPACRRHASDGSRPTCESRAFENASLRVSRRTTQFRGFRPPGDADGRQIQILYLDFDGASVDPGIFQGGPFGFEVPLSPLSAFLGGWGLALADEDALIDAIIADFAENVEADLEAVGLNSAFDIEIRNSRDHADPWGQPLVSRIVIGGSINEVQIGTVGIAQSIDVGNFDAEETALVLLDLLNGTGPFPASIASISCSPGMRAYPGAIVTITDDASSSEWRSLATYDLTA